MLGNLGGNTGGKVGDDGLKKRVKDLESKVSYKVFECVDAKAADDD